MHSQCLVFVARTRIERGCTVTMSTPFQSINDNPVQHPCRRQFSPRPQSCRQLTQRLILLSTRDGRLSDSRKIAGMKSVELAIDQPAVTVEEIEEPTMAGAGIELFDLDAMQLQSFPLRVRRVIVRLDACTIVYHSTNARVRTRTRVLEGRLAYVTFGPRARGTVNGLPIVPDMMLAVEPAAEGRFVVDAGYEAIAFLVHAQDIKDQLVTRGREADFRMPSGVELLQVDAEKVRTLYDWGKRLVDVAAREPRRFDEGTKERAAVQVELLETLLATLDTASSSEPTYSERTRQAHSLVVRAAEDHAMSHIDEPLHVTDLCRAAGISERALQYAFKEVMGMSPREYLVRLRLHRVRQALLAASQRTSTVSVEALKWGFWHFGEFSRAYKDCFGELPSDTLRRPPGGKRHAV
jgi:AraC-like DNA-binding protein